MDEPVPRLVVAAVGPEEAFVRARELLRAVGGERLALLVARAGAPLGREQLRPLGIVREPLGEVAHAGAEARRGVAEGVVEQAELDRAARADRLERRRGERAPSCPAPTRRGSR